MAFDLRDLLTAAQKRSYLADSSGSTQELIYLLKVAIRGDQNPIYAVDGTGDLPSLIDDSADTESIIYVRDEEKPYFKQDNEWRPLREPTIDWSGSNAGFFYGGFPAAPSIVASVQSFPFASSSTPFTNIGSLTLARSYLTGTRDYTNGNSYINGGYIGPAPGEKTTIDRHPNVNAPITVSNVGNLTAPSYRNSSASSITRAFIHMGFKSGAESTAIDSYQYASSVTSEDFGDLATPPGPVSTQYGVTDARNQTGFFRINASTDLQGFPFASTVGFTTSSFGTSPTSAPGGMTALSNPTTAYVHLKAGVVEKFAFASGSPVTISLVPGVATTDIVINAGGGASSFDKGFFYGQFPTPGARGATTEFPFAAENSYTTTIDTLNPPSNTGAYGGGSHF